MKVLSISTDRKVFEKGSAVRARLIDYGRFADELHVIVFAKRTHLLKEEKIADNIFIYPTNSLSRFTHICAAIALARKLKNRNVVADLVTTQDPFETGVAGLRIACMFHARLHVQVHTDFKSKYFARESLLNRLRVCVAKFILMRADAVRVVSGRIKKSIEKFVCRSEQIAVLPIFVDKETNKEILPEKDLKKKYPQFNFLILVVARLAHEKNIGSVIHAMHTIVSAKPKTGLIIVGDGPERLNLEKLVAHTGLTNNVFFEGWQEKLFSYYKTADVFVMPSLYEGYGMAAVEAVLAWCPVIMTDVGCAGEVIKDAQNGLILPVNDTKALMGALGRVISGDVKFSFQMPHLQTKEEYLTAYEKSWRDALR